MPVVIASIDPGGRSPRRRVVTFEGTAERATASRTVLAELGAQVGSAYASFDSFLTSLEIYARPAAVERSLDAISRRDRSHHELSQLLQDDGYDPPTVAAALERVAELGYIDDVRYAESRWRAGIAAGYGSRRIAAGLTRRGVSPDDIEAGFSAAREAGALRSDQDGAALLIARWKPNLGDRASRDKVLRRLVGRGYPYDVALRALSRPDLDDSE